jgi:hypothetical protein
MAKKRTNRGDFLDKYKASETFLLRPDKTRGSAGILEGFSPTGETVLIRTWPGGGDSDLQDIWRSELRVLHRLGGAPGAEEHIARLIDAGEDERGFHIVLAAGQRRPIAVLIDRARPGVADWLRVISAASNRRRLWQNLRRLAGGLEILHSQGQLHCNLDRWSVLSTGGSEPDFQLTGFEWSMRLMGAADKKGRPRADNEKPTSFLDDWADFARLAADLLRVKSDRLTNLAIPAHEVSENHRPFFVTVTPGLASSFWDAVAVGSTALAGMTRRIYTGDGQTYTFYVLSYFVVLYAACGGFR